MSVTLERSGTTATLQVGGASRDELFRETLRGFLDAIYPSTGEAGRTPDGQMLPVQVDGDTDERLLYRLLKEVARLAALEPSRLTAPRWLAFDEKRVTAQLPLVPGGPAPAVSVIAVAVRPSGQGLAAAVTFST